MVSGVALCVMNKGTQMNLFGFWKRQPGGAPAEVIQAAYDYYGLSPEQTPVIEVKQLNALSKNVWVVTLNDKSSAVVAYNPSEREHAVAAPWYGK